MDGEAGLLCMCESCLMACSVLLEMAPLVLGLVFPEFVSKYYKYRLIKINAHTEYIIGHVSDKLLNGIQNNISANTINLAIEMWNTKLLS